MKRFIYLFWNIINKIIFRCMRVSYGKGLSTFGLVRVRKAGKCTESNMRQIRMGNHVRLNSSFYINAIGGQTYVSIAVFNNGTIKIGNNVGISNSSLFARECIEIEDDVWIGACCRIYDNDFHSVYYDERMNGNVGIKTKKVLIKRGAFIGADCIILKGVTIGEKSVIGAGSVVTKSVPDGEIWAGNPAVYIRRV